MKIIKRNGTEDDFNYEKIVKAIEGANKEVTLDDELTNEQIVTIAKMIENTALSSTYTLTVEEIQDLVEDSIMDYKKYNLARAYSRYRYKRALVRKTNTTDESILSLIEYENEEIKQENSNKNPGIGSVQRDYMAGEVSKDLTKRFLVESDIWEAHEKGIIHFHDADYFAQRIHNCIESNGWITYRDDDGIKTIQLKDLETKYGYSVEEDGNIAFIPADTTFVLSRTGWTKINAISARKTIEDEPIYKIHVLGNIHLKATGNHKVPVIENGEEKIKFVKDLNIGDKLITFRESNHDIKNETFNNHFINLMKLCEECNYVHGSIISTDEIKSIDISYKTRVVYDLTTDDHHFIVNNFLVHNCDLVNLEDMLQNGTVISGTLIEKPHSFSTACNIATQIMAQVASSQYGGQSMSLAHLAPFVDVSRQKIKRDILDEWNVSSVNELNDFELNRYNNSVKKRLDAEINRGVQIIQYQVVTLMTTNGQAPFITLFMYLDEVPDGQLREDLAKIIEEVLKQRTIGTKNEKGVYITPAFPKLIYVLDKDNIHNDSKYFYLTKIAAECTAKRMVPDYISAKVMKKIKRGNVYTPMGCRSTLTVEDGVLNEDGSHKFYGRLTA